MDLVRSCSVNNPDIRVPVSGCRSDEQKNTEKNCKLSYLSCTIDFLNSCLICLSVAYVLAGKKNNLKLPIHGVENDKHVEF